MMDLLKQLKKPTSRCPHCGAENKCGVEAGKGFCWCFELPSKTLENKVTDDSQCLCRSCLEKL